MISPKQAKQPFAEENDILPPESESEFNVAEYLGMVRRHWKLVVAAVLVSLTAGAIHYAITPKEYLATATATSFQWRRTMPRYSAMLKSDSGSGELSSGSSNGTCLGEIKRRTP